MKNPHKTNIAKMNILNPLTDRRGMAKKGFSFVSKTTLLFSGILLMSGFIFPDSFKHFSHKNNLNFLIVNGIEAGSNTAVCAGDSTQLLATGGSNYTWTPADGLSCTNCADPKASPAATTLYFVTGEDGNGNMCTDSVTVTVSSAPQIDDTATTDLSDCDAADGSIAIMASGGTGNLEYSIDNGFNWQSGNTFSGLNSGIYNIAVRNDNGTCVVLGNDVTLTAPDAPEIQDVITNDPTQCDLPNGTIVISVDGGTGNYEFSIDNGTTWQVLNSFQFLSSGFYQILVRNNDGTCTVSGGTVNLSAAPDEPNITNIGVFHPTDCGGTNGLISVSLSNAGDFEFSNDGGTNWQASNSFLNLSAGNYDIRVRKTDGTCEVTGGTIILEDPELPVIDSVQTNDPTDCNVDDGIIVITASGGTGFLEYSVDGGTTWTFQNTFGTLAAGDYDIAVRNASTTCVTLGNTVTLNAADENPVINLIQPFDPGDCASADGSIVISATACGSNILEYTVDGGTNWQTSETFNNLNAGTYTIIVRNQGDPAAFAFGGQVTLSSPPPPIINNIQQTQPSCLGSDGEIVITATGNNGDLEYSNDGGTTWQTENNFPNLPPGIYELVVRFPNSPCQSNIQSFSLNPFDGPTVTDVMTGDDCDGMSGSITILATGTGDLEYTIDGGVTWVSTNVFAGLAAGTYPTGVREISSGCEIMIGQTTVATGASPTITGVTSNDPNDCGSADGSISIVATSPSGAVQYSIDGGNTWSLINSFSDLPAGDYEVMVRNADGSCAVSYVLNPVTLEDPGNVPMIDNISSSIPSACGETDGFILIDASGAGTIEYSINGGVDFQMNSSFTNLGPGAYTIVVRFVGSTCENTNTLTLGGNSVCVDTVQISIPFETTVVECLDSAVFQIPGTITSSTFCGLGNPNTVMAAALDDECITLDPADGFVGTSPDLICTVHCFDNDPNQCDTTIIQVTVLPEDCEDIISETQITQPFTGNPTEICVPLPISEALSLDLSLDGVPYTVNLSGCDMDSVWNYSYSFLFGGGFSGPYNLDSWVCNGGTFSTQFQDANDLADFMNMVDPAGMWMIDLATNNIIGGASGGGYGNMNITHIPTGAQSVMMTNFTAVSNGTIINVNNVGLHEFTVIDPNTGCEDTILIELTGQLPTIDTITISTFINTQSENICVDGNELPTGFINSLGFCALPENGNVPFASDSCVFYLPNTDFIGKDTFCLLACDNSVPQVCDSTIVIVCVEVPTDTLFINLPNQDPADTCLTDLIQLPNISTADICDINTNEIEATLNNDCITLDPADGFIGQSEICVVHCDDNIPANCDTTLIIVNVADPCANVDLIPVDEINVESNDNPTQICIPVPLTDAEQLDIELNGAPYTEPLTACAAEPPFTDGTTILVPGPGTYQLLVSDGMGCLDILNINVDSAAVCDPIFMSDSLTIESPDGNADFCMPFPFDEIGNYTIFIGGGLFGGVPVTCDNDLGSQINFDAFGDYEVVVLDTADCSDTIIISVIPEMMPPSDLDTVFVTTPMGVPIDSICFESDDLTDPIAGIAFCQLPSNGAAPVIGDSCVTYTPSAPFVGNDEFCVILCDGNIPPNCDSVWVIATMTPPTDIVFIEAPGTQPFDTCLMGDILQLPGDILSTEICGIFPNDVNITVNDECITIDLADDFTGMTEVCLIHCDDSFPQLCDTTVLVINNDILCDDIFTEESITLISADPDTEVCIPILPTDINNYNVNVDGAPYTGGFADCDVDSVFAYTYGLVFGMGNDGPYAVTWEVNSQTFMATVQNITELVDSMNVWHPAGNWADSSAVNLIVTSNLNDDYGQLVFEHLATTIVTTSQAVLDGFPNGSQVIINGFGNHILTVENQNDGCTDTLNILVINEDETLQILTPINTVSDTFCLDTTALSGVNAFVICETPQNGNINIIGFDCFTYTPDLDFVGLDTACVAVCDTSGFCDTTYVFITVESLCADFDFFGNDTLNLTTDNCQIPAEYCLPVPLDSIVNLSILDNGSVYSGGLVGCDNDTCVAYSYFSFPNFGSVGPYFLDSWTINGLGTFTGQFQDIEALVDSMNVWDDKGNWELDPTVLVMTNCGTSNVYSDINVTQIATGSIGMADPGVSFLPNGTQISLDTGFHELIFIDMMMGCEDTLLVQVTCDEDSTGCGISAISDEFIQVPECDTLVQFCVDVSIFDVSNFTITDNGAPYVGNVEVCHLDPSSIAVVLDTGFHELVLADSVKGCADTFNITISCLEINDIVINDIIPVGETNIYCLEDYGIMPSVIDSITFTCPDMQTGNADFNIDETDWCLEITGVTVGLDTACFKVFFADTCLTIEAFIEVTQPCTQELFDQDNLGQNLADCSVLEGEICLPVTLPELANQLIMINGVPYTENLVGCDFDSTLSLTCANLLSGGNLGPYILDEWLVDGNALTGVFEDCDELGALLNQLDPTGNWETIGNVIIGGNPNTMYGSLEITQELTGATQTIGFNASFVPMGTAFLLPVGSVEMTFQDTLSGCRDTLITTLDCLDTEIIEDVIEVGATDTLCFDTTELIGNFAFIDNACEDSSGEFVLFEILNDTCITYTGIEPGLDSACIILCDDLGLCDTTYVFITAISDDDMPPNAVNDTVITGMDLPVVINVFGNDENVVFLDSVYILNQPNHGDVMFLPDFSVNYVPDPGYCDSAVPDSFSYVICNPIGCDTATVYVFVQCTELEIFNGFSPNNDGINDTFVIQGLNLFGSHRLYIYNRWGNRVFESDNYQNNWDGTWEGKDLPSGTYFYMLEVEGESTRTGYVQLHR